jgi:bacillithiol system protein YtxJ
MSGTTLETLEQYQATLAAHPRLMLFKHSPICPTSATAHREWSAFVSGHPDVPCFIVDVIEARALARGLAEKCGVTHQSPQVLLFEEGQVSWHASHWDITADTLKQAWGTTQQSPTEGA